MIDEYLSRKFRNLGFIAIVFVLYIHAYNLTQRYLQPFTLVTDPKSTVSFLEYFVSNGIGRFAVPIFFTISGYLFFLKFELTPRLYAEKVLKRIRSLAIPYFLWSALGILFVWGIQHWDFGRIAVDTWDVWSDTVTLPQIIQRWVFAPVPFQLWFVRDLLLYSLLSPILFLALSHLKFWPILPVAVLWFLHTNFVIMEAEGILSFMLGAYLAIHKIPIPRRIPAWIPLTSLLVWLALLFLKTNLAFSNQMFLTPLHKSATLLGFITIWFLYDLVGKSLNDNTALKILATSTTFIYFAHEPLLNCITNYWLFEGGQPLLVYTLAPLLTIVTCVLIGATLHQLMRPVFSLLTGGRGT